MRKNKKKRNKQAQTEAVVEQERIKDFLDMYLPGHVKIYDSYIIQDSKYRAIWAIRSYPQVTTDQAILAPLGRMPGITLHVISQELTSVEEAKIVQNAANRSRMVINSSTEATSNIKAQEDMKDIDALIRQLHREKKHLMKTSVFIEMSADSLAGLDEKELEVQNFVQPAAITVDRLIDRQEQGFLSVMPGGKDQFHGEFNRALPSDSVADLYPFSYTGKSDEHGFCVGKDAQGSYIFVDISKHDFGHTNSNICVLGNAGMGKSYLMKGLLTNIAELGENILVLDPEGEYGDLILALGGSYLDLMGGEKMINVLEPKSFTKPDDGESVNSPDSELTRTYMTKGALSQHISFLRDFFKIYKPELSGMRLDILEILLVEMYHRFGIDDKTDMTRIPKEKFPTMSDLWAYAYDIYMNFKPDKYMFERGDLREVLLAIQSICKGSQAHYFDGHTNIENTRIIGMNLKGITESDESLKNAMLFNCMSYMSDKLLNQKNTYAFLDEFYLFLSSPVSVTYCRNVMKRSRKYGSGVVIGTQQIQDFLDPRIAHQTKPLLALPAHRFIFNCGNVDPQQFVDVLSLESKEYEIVSQAQRGHCLYQCGQEKFNLLTHFPDYKTALFGSGGGQ